MGKLKRAVLPSLEIFLFVLIFWFTLYIMPTMLNSDGDLGKHLAVGAYILDTGTIPREHYFSYTLQGAPFVPHEWLYEVGVTLLYRAWALNGIAWLTALLLASTYTLLAVGLRRQGVSAPIAFAGALAAFITGSIHHLPRPHLVTLLLFTIFLLCLNEYRRKGNWRVLIPLPMIMVVWANLHGAFVVGLILTAMFVVGALLEREARAAATYTAVLVALYFASWINPVGADLVNHVFGYAQSRFLLDLTVEYQSPNFHFVNTYPFAALILFSVVIGARGRLNASWTQVVVLVGWTGLALYASRNIPFYAQAAVLILAGASEVWIRTRSERAGEVLTNLDGLMPVLSGWAIAVVVVIGLVGLEAGSVKLDLFQEGNIFAADHYPVGAVDYVLAHPPKGEMLNELTPGGYLLFRMYPRYRVFIDGQTDFYGEDLTREYLRIVNAEPGWEAELQKYDVGFVILPPTYPLARALDGAEGWTREYEDAVAGVWVRID